MKQVEPALLWGLDRSVLYLNHGSFGACPLVVLAAQTQLRLQMESEPVDFLSGALPALLAASRVELARFLSADEADLVFVPNATTGVNAVLQSLARIADESPRARRRSPRTSNKSAKSAPNCSATRMRHTRSLKLRIRSRS